MNCRNSPLNSCGSKILVVCDRTLPHFARGFCHPSGRPSCGTASQCSALRWRLFLHFSFRTSPKAAWSSSPSRSWSAPGTAAGSRAWRRLRSPSRSVRTTRSPATTPRLEARRAIFHLALFVFVALLICWFNAALRAAQEGLRRSEQNFRSLVTNAPYGICRCDARGYVLDVNPGAGPHARLRLSPRSWSGRNLSTLYADGAAVVPAGRLLSPAAAPSTDLVAEWRRKDDTTTVGAPFRPRHHRRSTNRHLRALRRRRHRAPRARAATAPVAEDGSHRPSGRRHRARLQQSADGDLGLLRVPAGTPRPRSGVARPGQGDFRPPPSAPPRSPGNCWPSAASRCSRPKSST